MNISVTLLSLREQATNEAVARDIQGAVFISVLSLVGTVGNAILIDVYMHGRKKILSTYFIVVLGFIDLSICSIIMPLRVTFIFFPAPFAVCGIYQGLAYMSVSCSVYLFLLIAVDRYQSVCRLGHPLFSKKHLKGIFVYMGFSTFSMAIVSHLYLKGDIQVLDGDRRVSILMREDFPCYVNSMLNNANRQWDNRYIMHFSLTIMFSLFMLGVGALYVRIIKTLKKVDAFRARSKRLVHPWNPNGFVQKLEARPCYFGSYSTAANDVHLPLQAVTNESPICPISDNDTSTNACDCNNKNSNSSGNGTQKEREERMEKNAPNFTTKTSTNIFVVSTPGSIISSESVEENEIEDSHIKSETNKTAAFESTNSPKSQRPDGTSNCQAILDVNDGDGEGSVGKKGFDDTFKRSAVIVCTHIKETLSGKTQDSTVSRINKPKTETNKDDNARYKKADLEFGTKERKQNCKCKIYGQWDKRRRAKEEPLSVSMQSIHTDSEVIQSPTLSGDENNDVEENENVIHDRVIDIWATKVSSISPVTATKVSSISPVTATKVSSISPVTATKVSSISPVTATKVSSISPVTATKVSSISPVTATKVSSISPVTATKVSSTSPVAESNVDRLRRSPMTKLSESNSQNEKALPIKKRHSSSTQSTESCRHQHEGRDNNPIKYTDTNFRPQLAAMSVRVLRRLFLVTLFYYLSWLPYYLIELGILPYDNILIHTFFMANMVNPLIHLTTSQQFRQEVIFRFNRFSKSSSTC